MFRKSILICLVFLIGIFSACTFIKRLANPTFTRITFEVETISPDSDKIVEQSRNVIGSRLNAFGIDYEFEKPEENTAKNNQFSIKIYDMEKFEKVSEYILEQGKLELFGVVSLPNPSPIQTYQTEASALKSLGDLPPTDQRVLKYSERDSINDSTSAKWIVVKTPPIIVGTDIRHASAVNDANMPDSYQISFSFKPDAAVKFGDWTGKNIGNYLAVSLNDEVKSVAYIKSQIFDQGQIDGRFTKKEAENLALILKSGALPVKVKIVEENNNKS